MEQQEYRVSVLMPCLNEENTIEDCVRKARDFLDIYSPGGEVLVVDNGSTDTSAGLAKKAGARVISEPKRGYGAAILAGISVAKSDYILMLDADGSYDAAEGKEFLEKLLEGYQLVIGNRFLGGIEPGAMPWLHRYIGNPLLSGLGRKWYRTEIGDFHCGMRAFCRRSVLELGLQTTQMEFASEMILKAVRKGLRIAEVPCRLYPDGRNGKSHLRTFRDGMRHLWCLWHNRK